MVVDVVRGTLPSLRCMANRWVSWSPNIDLLSIPDARDAFRPQSYTKPSNFGRWSNSPRNRRRPRRMDWSTIRPLSASPCRRRTEEWWISGNTCRSGWCIHRAPIYFPSTAGPQSTWWRTNTRPMWPLVCTRAVCWWCRRQSTNPFYRETYSIHRWASSPRNHRVCDPLCVLALLYSTPIQLASNVSNTIDLFPWNFPW